MNNNNNNNKDNNNVTRSNKQVPYIMDMADMW